ncbi:SDR family oxidoreductase [Bacillus pseudomycoides]|uniref:SDR family oxidoreductase n=1 Tax=Bacillus pseudomycoides TaxID=64104 RepID=UPI000BEBECBE|nr:SDR family oxidoreductase [Bacillus pseudomycoides]PEE40327.1 3-oxoacyl-ACP reductase [Bacillus pseudomycoides]PGA92549.1 3-oxoacyl-ACP reductase [Bacillus pseudomycoides]PHF50136.1 3-oxoacyl-ACP reductase [Bacillus pseudomycoides]
MKYSNLKGGMFVRHALITAGTKGLGKQVTENLLAKGYSVTVTYHSDMSAVETMKEKYKHIEERLQFVQADVTKKEDLHKMVEEAISRFGKIDFLINNAGPYVFERKKLIDYEEDEWNEMIQGNLTAVFRLLKLVVPIMRKQHFGRIINYGFQGADSAPGWMYRSAFAAAKVGLVSLTKTVSYEEAEYGITANMVCPGDIIGEMKEATIKQARTMKDIRTPIGRSGTGEDIARTISFLCEEDSDMITGTIIEVTGAVDVIHRYRPK